VKTKAIIRHSARVSVTNMRKKVNQENMGRDYLRVVRIRRYSESIGST